MGPLPVALLMFAAVLFAPIANAAGDPAAGETLAVTCVACHGQGGAAPIDPSYPVLAGQNEAYALRQLQAIQAGRRVIPLMTGLLNGKSDQDLADMAAYFAAQPGVVGQADADEATLALAESIYRGGILEKGVAACAACHSPMGDGNAPAGFPSVAGQPRSYTIAQLTAYREGQRVTDEGFGGMMRSIASRLTDTEIAALADYLRGLH
ncbi:MAG: c-type cytochrome [Pseudomonadales bacterium]